MNDKFETILKKAVVEFVWRTEKSHEISESGELVSEPRFQPGPPVFEAGVLITLPRHSVKILCRVSSTSKGA